jgi:hypothetical protein
MGHEAGRWEGIRFRPLAAAAAVGGLAVALFLGPCSGGVEVEREVTVEEMEVTKLEPIALECRARTVASFANQTNLNTKILGVDIANDYKANTDGEAETLTCLDSRGVKVEVHPDDSQTVHIPVEAVTLFTRIVEDKTITTMDYDRVADAGRGVWNLLDAIGIGKGINEDLRTLDAEVRQASLTHAANSVQEACGERTWEITKQVIQDGYRLAAEGQGIDPETVEISIEPSNERPDFTGPYTQSGKFEYSVAGAREDGGLECRIASGAYRPVIRKTNQPEAGDSQKNPIANFTRWG